MADTSSGGASDLISLPSGGGALRGFGEKFSPDLHTGTANFTVPITLPAGRNDLGPELRLVYSTGSGNGPFGLGWSLPVPGVTRRTDRGVPRYEASDVFVVSGTEELVRVDGNRFRPRTEVLFDLIEHRIGTDDVWVVRGREGRVSTYGTSGVTDGADPATVVDPANPRRIFAWRLTSTVDQFGNRVEYVYDREDGNDPPHRWSQTYLSEIRYADYGASDDRRFLVKVRLRYELRPDPFSDHRAGFEIRTVRRCTGLDVFTDAGTDQLVRSYRFGYRADAENGVSLLHRVDVAGHDGARTERLPPLEFGYTDFRPDQRRLFPLTGPDLPTASVADPGFELVDLTGDGLPDVLELGDVARHWRNLGHGRLERPRAIPEAPAGLRLGQPGVQLLDADGDGRLDLMVSNPDLSGYFPMRFDGLFDRRSFHRYAVAPSVDLTDPEVRLIDLTGDGVTDALRTGSGLECFFNDPQRGWTGTRRVARRDLADFPNVSFTDRRVKLADLSGDGLTDIAYVSASSVSYWPNLGHGDWGARVRMANSPRLPPGHDPDRVLVGDVDGDGLADLVYVDDRKVTLWVNRGGNGWSDPIEIRGTPPVNGRVAVRLADVLGTGVPGLLWSSEASPLGRPTLFFLDFTGGLKPHLLSTIDNNLGAVTRVTYAPSTTFAVLDGERPGTRWRTPLPFPVQVVAKVEAVDALSGGRLTSEYSYHHGYWDGVEREFRGFGRVDQRDTEVVSGEFFSPPTETRTWFHQGAVGDPFGEPDEGGQEQEYWPGDPAALPGTSLPAGLDAAGRRDAFRALRGSILRTELYALDGTHRAGLPFTVTEHAYGVRRLAGGAQFPHKVAERVTQWERGDDPHTVLTVTGEYDQFGFPRVETVIAVPRGRDYRVPAAPAEPYLATHTHTTYAHRADEELYLAGRVARLEVFDVVNDGSPSALMMTAQAKDGSAPRSMIAETCNFYDGEPFQGRPLGQLGRHGVLARTETLVLTPEVVEAVYGSEPPAYLLPGAQPHPGHPPEFAALVPALAGYVVREGRHYAVTAQNRYDCHGPPSSGPARGLLVATRDPLGHETRVSHDEFAMFPVEVVDPGDLVTSAVIDYRTLQPAEVVDANGNRTTVTFSPLGLVESVAEMGKPGAAEGDTRDQPGVGFVHDLLAFVERGAPVSVRTTERVHHVTDDSVTAEERDEVLETTEYSDGFGRVLQTRARTDDFLFDENGVGAVMADRVVVTGARAYDNKGRVVRAFEPYLATGLAYAPPRDADFGAAVTTFYEPRGRPARVVRPDGSEQRIVYGVPTILSEPEDFRPSPWEAFTYDAADNGSRTHGLLDHPHVDTPSSTEVDALGRAVRTVVRNGRDPAQWITTRNRYDLAGNLLTVTDGLGRTAFRHFYDRAGNRLRVESIDAGPRTTVFDAAGNPVETRDGKESLTLRAYDGRNRPTRVWARDSGNERLTLRERIVYGDSSELGLDAAAAAARNLLGRRAEHFDEAGVLVSQKYDFKGNLLETRRRFIGDGPVLGTPGFRVDWQPAAGESFAQRSAALLETTEYLTTRSFDALDRVRRQQLPAAADGRRPELRYRYNRTGLLERVDMDGTAFVERIAYNARGQRLLVALGNGTITRYAYDPRTFRLAHQRTHRFTRPDSMTYEAAGPALRDAAYAYDLAGNITSIVDRHPGAGVPGTASGPDQLVRTYGYDAIYRLISATGRECAATPTTPFDPTPRCSDVTSTRLFQEAYAYDPEGNLRKARRAAGSVAVSRGFSLVDGTNRLAQVQSGTSTFVYGYDGAGNVTSEGGSRRFEWDHADRLRTFRTQASASAPSVEAYYLYDNDGGRVKKVVRKSDRVETTVYIGGTFDHCRVTMSGRTRESTTVHIGDGQIRMAELRSGEPAAEDTTPALKYHYVDHLGSSTAVTDGAGNLISREEYTPFGETAFGSYARKRYRFTGKERDEESGLSYHGARYYAPWLGRWTSLDPAGAADGSNRYVYATNNPVRLVDPDGRASKDWWRRVIARTLEAFPELLGEGKGDPDPPPSPPIVAREERPTVASGTGGPDPPAPGDPPSSGSGGRSGSGSGGNDPPRSSSPRPPGSGSGNPPRSGGNPTGSRGGNRPPSGSGSGSGPRGASGRPPRGGRGKSAAKAAARLSRFAPVAGAAMGLAAAADHFASGNTFRGLFELAGASEVPGLAQLGDVMATAADVVDVVVPEEEQVVPVGIQLGPGLRERHPDYVPNPQAGAPLSVCPSCHSSGSSSTTTKPPPTFFTPVFVQ